MPALLDLGGAGCAVSIIELKGRREGDRGGPSIRGMLGGWGRPGPQLAECAPEGPSGAGAHAPAVLLVSTFLRDVAHLRK